LSLINIRALIVRHNLVEPLFKAEPISTNPALLVVYVYSILLTLYK